MSEEFDPYPHTDAVFFYNIALNVMNYYFTEVSLNISENYSIYPFYKLFTNDNANSFNVTSPPSLMVFIALCNNVWKKYTEGDYKTRLRNCVTTIFQELEASMCDDGSKLTNVQFNICIDRLLRFVQ